MSLYTDTQPSSQLTTASASTQAPSKRTWWQAVTFQRPKPTAPVTPPSPPSPQAQTPTEAATNSTGVDLGQRRQRSTIPMAKPPQESMLPKHQQGLQQGGAQEPVWMYPSEEMFYKAMKRKVRNAPHISTTKPVRLRPRCVACIAGQRVLFCWALMCVCVCVCAAVVCVQQCVCSIIAGTVEQVVSQRNGIFLCVCLCMRGHCCVCVCVCVCVRVYVCRAGSLTHVT